MIQTVKDPDRARKVALATAIALALAAPAEGLRRVAYFDPPGILTVCRGHTGPDVIKGKVYSLAECDKFFSDDMRAAIATVERCQSGLPPNVLAAFADATFNIGQKIVCSLPNSTAARLLRAGRIAEACRELPKWSKATIAGVLVTLPGLTKRRLVEYKVCMTGVTP
jgi:lysozyme